MPSEGNAILFQSLRAPRISGQKFKHLAGLDGKIVSDETAAAIHGFTYKNNTAKISVIPLSIPVH